MIKFNKRNAEQAADRLFQFYSGRMQDRILVGLGYPCVVKEPPLVEPAQDDNVMREREPLALNGLPILLEMQRRHVRHNFENPDDSLYGLSWPSIIPVFHFENAIETAMLGGKVRFMGTRLHTFGDPVEPLIRDYESFHWQLPSEDNVWFQRYLEAYRFMVQHAGNDFALSFQAGFGGMNLAVQLRGAVQAYVDMTEDPENLHRLLDYAVDLTMYLYGRVAAILGIHNQWLCGGHPLAKFRCMSRQSVDAYALCRPGTLRQWERDNLARLNQRLGKGCLHIHENSRHVIEEITEIPGWSTVGFTDGPGWPRSFDIRWELRRRMKDIPIEIRCDKEEFLAALNNRDLPGNTQYFFFGVDSLEEAKRIMDKVRAYRI